MDQNLLTVYVLRAVAGRVMGEGLLAQFPPAKERIYRVKGRARDGGKEEAPERGRWGRIGTRTYVQGTGSAYDKGRL